MISRANAVDFEITFGCLDATGGKGTTQSPLMKSEIMSVINAQKTTSIISVSKDCNSTGIAPEFF
ncbi:MAG: hypothetical protein KME32_33810 [Mojavia pulchra JT2-VF2]|uniref:Uncharacterized protein n=1 Tax=Mojavia pulchra JT2-VF2 TaxID=287848 RepID=A0A951UK50_9NOST|nr:hypothetical protein [Mojavia pulchra JT2-VF2]